MSVKYTLRGYFWCFWCSCHALVVMSNRWNQYNFSILHQLYMREQVNFSTIANIFRLIQAFKYQCCGFQVHFKSFWVYNFKTKREFCSKCAHYIMGYIMNLGSIFFLLSLVLNLAYIDYSLCQIWNVYRQYLWCCDYSNKCLFLVIQQAEVLLIFFFFGECKWICFCG